MTAVVGMTMLEHVNLTFNFLYTSMYIIYTYLLTNFVHIQLDTYFYVVGETACAITFCDSIFTPLCHH